MTSWSALSQSDSQAAQGAESSQEFEHTVPVVAVAGLQKRERESERERSKAATRSKGKKFTYLKRLQICSRMNPMFTVVSKYSVLWYTPGPRRDFIRLCLFICLDPIKNR